MSAAQLPSPCTKCRQHPAAEGRKLCESCLATAAAYRSSCRSDSTKCSRGCGRDRVSKRAFCGECLELKRKWNKQLYNERAARGQCTCCTVSASVGLFCFSHWLKNVGNAHGLGNKKGIAILKELWEEQGGRCAITGEALIPGSTASIDHIIPKSRGGLSTKENLQWVTLFVNRIKWDMTRDEFIAVCRTVVSAQDARDAKGATTMKNLRSN